MTIWEDRSVLEHVLEALAIAQSSEPDPHHFGASWMTAYQLAIKVHAAHPDIQGLVMITDCHDRYFR